MTFMNFISATRKHAMSNKDTHIILDGFQFHWLKQWNWFLMNIMEYNFMKMFIWRFSFDFVWCLDFFLLSRLIVKLTNLYVMYINCIVQFFCLSVIRIVLWNSRLFFEEKIVSGSYKSRISSSRAPPFVCGDGARIFG